LAATENRLRDHIPKTSSLWDTHSEGKVIAVILAVAVFLAVRFEQSPHRRQYVTLKYDSNAIHALVVLPTIKNKTSVVILVHEIFGGQGDGG
jgi:hypothetical protein